MFAGQGECDLRGGVCDFAEDVEENFWREGEEACWNGVAVIGLLECLMRHEYTPMSEKGSYWSILLLG